MFTSNTQLAPHPEVLTTPLVDEGIVLLHLQTSHYYTLNVTGAQIWQGIQAQQTVGELSQALVARYALSLAEAEATVQTLVTQLTAATLVQEVTTQ